MPDVVSRLRRNYPRLARDLLSPVLELLRVGRETCDGDLDRTLIILAVAMRTAEHHDIAGYDLDAVLSGDVAAYPSLSTNVRSIAESTGIPKESVRRKVEALIKAGWIRRDGHRLSLAPRASVALTPLRDQVLRMAARNHQTVAALPPKR